jgi:hypothetical protein
VSSVDRRAEGDSENNAILGRTTLVCTGLTKAKIMLVDKKLLKYIVKPNLSWHTITCTIFLNIMLSKI